MKSRALSIVVLLTMLISSCAGGASVEDDTTADDTTLGSSETAEPSRENTPDSLPADLDFGGETVRIVCRDQEFSVDELLTEQTGDIVDDAVYKRNADVEERLNIVLDIIPSVNAPLDMATAIKASVLADSDDYDLVAGTQWAVIPQSLEGIYKDLSNAKYLDLEQPWWWSDYIDELRIGNEKTFFVEGDLCLLSIQHMSCIFFNKSLARDNGIDPDALYQTVLDGKWTYDLLSEYSASAYRDVNGDTNVDEGDIFGFMARPETESDHFTYTAGNKMTVRDSDGIPSLNVNNEHFIDYMDMLYELYYNNEGVWVTKDETLMRNRFAEDGTLFLTNRLISCNYLRDMKSEYGIIPMPKYNESQEEYGALVHDSATIYCVPVTVDEKLDTVCATLEAMCAESYRVVVPAYYETALKVKYTSDSESGIIIDMIRDAATTDFAYAYNYALNGAGMVFRTMLGEKNNNFSSVWAKISSGAEEGLDDLIKLYSNLE